MDWSAFLFLAGNAVGGFLKTKVPAFKAKYIPLAVLATQLVIRFLEGVVAVPDATADAAPAALTSLAGFFDAGFWMILKKSLVDTLLAVGLYSATKNVKQGLAGNEP